ncbi:unnamed protein product, partial [Rotaria sp. Silwood2]
MQLIVGRKSIPVSKNSKIGVGDEVIYMKPDQTRARGAVLLIG